MKLRWHQKKTSGRDMVLPEISLTPLIDTALVLLIIFMIAAPLSKKDNGLLVELPNGTVKETPDDMKEDAAVIVDARGKIGFNGTIVTQQQLLEKLAHMVKSNNQLTVHVKGDKGASYGTVVELVDAIKTVQGVRYVALATTRPVA